MIKLVSDTIDKNDINELISWLSQENIPKLTKGELTWELESKWAKKIGTKYSVFVNSGSSSILLTLAALKETNRLKNLNIVVPALSWATDVSSPMLLGYNTVMCDCNLEDLSCDLNHLENLFKEHKPSVFILVSPLGLVPRMNQVLELCKKYDVILLEDVCESMGSKYQGKYLGTFGFASFFSMYFGHHLSAISVVGSDKTFFIFSDDISWCKENFNFLDNVIYCEDNEDYEDLYLMSLCNDNIIANSSFSWWGAWLNNNKNKKVVAPKKWFGPSKSNFKLDDLYFKNTIIL